MSDTAYARYSNRTVTKRSAGRWDSTEVWIVSGIQNTATLKDGIILDAWQGEAVSAQGLPQIGDVNDVGNMVCVSLLPRSLGDQGTCYVDVKWQEDPLTLPVEVHYFTAGKMKTAWRGKFTDCSSGPPTIPPTGTMNAQGDVRNTAMDRFNPMPQFPAPLERIEVAQHVSLKYHDGIDWSQYVKRWNSADFTVTTNDPDNPKNTSTRTFPKGTLFFDDKRAPEAKDPFLHRILTCTFLYDPDTWGIRLANLGPRANFTAAGKPGSWTGNWPSPDGLHPVIDMLGRPYGGIAELDYDGTQMFPATLSDPTTMPAAVVYAWFPVDDSGALLSAEFGDLDLFTPERELKVP